MKLQKAKWYGTGTKTDIRISGKKDSPEKSPHTYTFWQKGKNIQQGKNNLFGKWCWKSWISFSSVAQSCLTLWDPMNRSTPGLPVHHQLPEFTQTHTHRVSDAILSSVVPFPSCPQSLPASGSFPISQLFASGSQSTGVSASASVLPMNTQDWSPLGWTGWISLQSKGLSRVFSNTTVQKHQFFSAQLSSQSNSHIHTWPLEKA